MRWRKRRLIRVAVLPTVLTLGNLLSGFASVLYLLRGKLEPAAWMVLVAMMFDALDGKVARVTRTASRFGAQLDSLSDAISFGLAPALLVIQAMTLEAVSGRLPKIVLVAGGLYLCCAVLRLARFTVETGEDDLSHQSFSGLPSPGAAGVVASALLTELFLRDEGFLGTALLVHAALPYTALYAGILMVSRFRYPHLVNQMFQGHQPFAHLVLVIFASALVAYRPELAFCLGFLVFSLIGPVQRIARALLRSPVPGPETRPETDTAAD